MFAERRASLQLTLPAARSRPLLAIRKNAGLRHFCSAFYTMHKCHLAQHFLRLKTSVRNKKLKREAGKTHFHPDKHFRSHSGKTNLSFQSLVKELSSLRFRRGNPITGLKDGSWVLGTFRLLGGGGNAPLPSR